MPLAALAVIVTLLAVVPVSGQTPASDQHPFGLDPYKPSDAALLRSLGGALATQMSLPDLRTLDPYKPSHAALLRQLGGALPLWGLVWYPLPGVGPVMRVSECEAPVAAIASQTVERSPGGATADAAPVDKAPSRSWMATLRPPESNDGVWINFAQRTWIAAGKAVPFDDSQFERVGEYGVFPVFRRARARDDLIYIPTREGLIAPYRAKSGPP